MRGIPDREPASIDAQGMDLSKPEPKLYICDKADACRIGACSHHQKHTKEQAKSLCAVPCLPHNAKCIPYEEKDWACSYRDGKWCPGRNSTYCERSCQWRCKPEERDWFVVSGNYVLRSKDEAVKFAREFAAINGGPYRAFRWSEGV